MGQNDLHTLLIYQNRYFEILSEFFISVTGKTPQQFSSLNSFPESIRNMGEEISKNTSQASSLLSPYANLESKLKKLYLEESSTVFKAAQNIDACKLNLGGSTRFAGTQLNATRKALLYSDIVLIPDPIMPWLEKKRDEEEFQHVIPLQMAFFVLHLSDLTGNEFDIPPFFIFPSWEKTLEDNDKITQENSIQLITDIFSYYIDPEIETFKDIVEIGARAPNDFLEKIDSTKLFVSPGGEVGESLKEALKNYKSEMRKWRSTSWCDRMLSKSDLELVINGICERIQPHYHLFENADEMRSHPFLCIDAQAHYYQLISAMKNRGVSPDAGEDLKTDSILKSLVSSRLDFLANIEDHQIVEIRKSNENIQFRRELRDLVNSLPAIKIQDIGYVASEVCAHIESVISKHEKQINSIKEKYSAKYKYTAIVGTGTLSVTMFPVLAPFLGALLPIGLSVTAGKYISDRLSESAELNQNSHSMMGVLSLAKNKVQR